MVGKIRRQKLLASRTFQNFVKPTSGSISLSAVEACVRSEKTLTETAFYSDYS
jgi:hypothetical protein